ncbi:hypothetical protein S245_055209, partial [Arachis hypogaea]
WQVQVANLQRSIRGDTESWKLYLQLGLRASKSPMPIYHKRKHFFPLVLINALGVKCGIYGANCPGWIISMEACNAHGLYCVPLYDTL